MTGQIANTIQSIPAGRDARALHIAKALRDAIDAECVILFGSRARADWTERSDIDLMIIEPEIPEPARRAYIERAASEMAERVYHEYIPVDFVYLSRVEYERKSLHTLNHVSRFARREGVVMPRNSESFLNDNGASRDPDDSDEPAERSLRIADTNSHYSTMHFMLDAGLANKIAVYNAHQTLEHAMKALISAQGREYPHTHRLDTLATCINANDPTLSLQPRSDLLQLNNYAGGSRYGPLLTPISDFNDMANRATDDLSLIYDEIARLTAENPWAVLPEGSDDPIRPRHR